MKVQQFCDQCAQSANQKVKGFDFTVLLPLVIDLIVDMLGNCGRDDEQVIATINSGDFWSQWAIRSAVKKVNKQERIRMPVRDVSNAILDQAKATKDSELKEMLQEVRSNVPDFHGVWS